MLLRELSVQDDRTVRSVDVRFDPTTVLIGENGCGAVRLLDLLELVLGADPPAVADDVAERAEGLRVVLTFEEREVGEWSAPEHAPLEAVLPPARRKPRRLVLEAVAEPGEDDAERGVVALVRRVPQAPDPETERAVVDHVLRASPLIRVSGGAMTARGADSRKRFDVSLLEPDVADLVSCILRSAEDVLRGATHDPETLLEQGFRAARELLERRPEHVDVGGGGLTRSVLEILGSEPDAEGTARGAPTRYGATVGERLGVLLLLAAVLRRLPAGLPPGCEPIWVIEEPEAHLHPMTLASAAHLFEQIRWQKILTTQSGDLLARMPLGQIRRLVRHEGRVHCRAVRPEALSSEDLRRVGHHLRARRGVAMFARVWLLVEGESEFWILPQVAGVLGYDFDRAGIACVEYAQSGLEPLLRTAGELGIEWHLLADGDDAGAGYATTARRFLSHREARSRVTVLEEHDIEHCLWQHGYHEELRGAAGGPFVKGAPARKAIPAAVRRKSKPGLALLLVESIARRGPAGVPGPLARVVEACHALAASSPARAAASAPDPVSRR